MKNTKRALRRHHYYRLKETRKNYHGNNDEWVRTHYSEKEIDAMRASIANTACRCSCAMCGNPRRTWWDGNPRTMQEWRADIRKEEQVIELYSNV